MLIKNEKYVLENNDIQLIKGAWQRYINIFAEPFFVLA